MLAVGEGTQHQIRQVHVHSMHLPGSRVRLHLALVRFSDDLMMLTLIPVREDLLTNVRYLGL